MNYIAQYSFVAIDFETLASVKHNTLACEIGMVKYENGKEVDSFHSFIRPIKEASMGLWNKRNLPHISKEDIMNAPTFAELHPKIKDFMGQQLLVCHHKETDLNLIYWLEKEQNVKGTYCNGYADTEKISNDNGVVGDLEERYERILHKPMVYHHQALYDARACAEIFIELSNQIDDISKYVIKEPYIPKEEQVVRNSPHSQTVSSEPLWQYLEDESIPTIDFTAKKFVISGASSYRDQIVERLIKLGAKKVGDLKQKVQTPDFFIIGKEVGPSKIEAAKDIKINKPESLHILSQEAVARFLGLD